FSPDGRLAASASWDRTVRLWDVASGRPVRELTGHQAQVHDVAYSPDGRRLVTAGWDATVRLWDVASGRELRCFRGHQDRVEAALFSPDGRLVASASGHPQNAKGHDFTV